MVYCQATGKWLGNEEESDLAGNKKCMMHCVLLLCLTKFGGRFRFVG
jgi:hypothetical protein